MLRIWESFQSREEWRFLGYLFFFRFREIHVFVLCKQGKWWRNKQFHVNNKILNLEYLQKYWSSVLETWHQKFSWQMKQNGNYVVTMATTNETEWELCCYHGNILGSSLLLWTTKLPHFQPFKVRQRILLWMHMVPSEMVGSAWSLFKVKSGN